MPWQRPEQALVVRSTHPTSLLWGLHCEEQQGAGGHDESPGQQSAAGEVKNVANVVANARSAGESSAAEEHFFTSRLQPPTDDMKLHHLLNHPQAVLFISLRSFFTHRPLKCFGVGVLAEWNFSLNDVQRDEVGWFEIDCEQFVMFLRMNNRVVSSRKKVVDVTS